VRAAQLLHGLGFTPKQMEKRTRDMSGGWRMRVALARALFAAPTLLLLGASVAARAGVLGGALTRVRRARRRAHKSPGSRGVRVAGELSEDVQQVPRHGQP